MWAGSCPVIVKWTRSSDHRGVIIQRDFFCCYYINYSYQVKLKNLCATTGCMVSLLILFTTSKQIEINCESVIIIYILAAFSFFHQTLINGFKRKSSSLNRFTEAWCRRQRCLMTWCFEAIQILNDLSNDFISESLSDRGGERPSSIQIKKAYRYV